MKHDRETEVTFRRPPIVSGPIDFIHIVLHVISTKPRGIQHLLKPLFWSHRLTMVIVAAFIFLYYIITIPSFQSQPGKQLAVLVMFLACNLFFAFAARIPQRLRSGILWEGHKSNYIRFTLDVGFISAYVYFELAWVQVDGSVFVFMYAIPLLMAGYYLSLRVATSLALLCNLFVLGISYVVGTDLFSTTNTVAMVINFGSPLVMNISGGFVRTYLMMLEKMKTEIYKKSIFFSAGKISEQEFFNGLLESVKFMLGASHAVLLSRSRGAREVRYVMGDRLPRDEIPIGGYRYGVEEALIKGSYANPSFAPNQRLSVFSGGIRNHMSVSIPSVPHELSMVIEICRKDDMLPFTEAEQNLVRNLVDHYPEMRKIRDEVRFRQLASNVARLARSCATTEELVKEFLIMATILTDSRHCSYWEYHPDSDELTVRASLGLKEEMIKDIPRLPCGAYSHEALFKGNLRLIPDHEKDDGFLYSDIVKRHHPELRSILIVPLVAPGTRVGVLHFWASTPEKLHVIENLFSLFADHLAAFIIYLRYRDPLVVKAMDDYKEYFRKNHFIKEKERISIKLGLEENTVVDRLLVKVRVSGNCSLRNISDEEHEAEVSLVFHSPLCLKQGFEADSITCIETFCIKHAGEVVFEKSGENGLAEDVANEECDFRVAIPVGGGDAISIDYSVYYYLPATAQDSFLTERLSVAPQFSIEWGKELVCKCMPFSHESRKANTNLAQKDGRTIWTCSYPKSHVILPYQGVHARWTPASSQNVLRDGTDD